MKVKKAVMYCDFRLRLPFYKRQPARVNPLGVRFIFHPGVLASKSASAPNLVLNAGVLYGHQLGSLPQYTHSTQTPKPRTTSVVCTRYFRGMLRAGSRVNCVPEHISS